MARANYVTSAVSETDKLVILGHLRGVKLPFSNRGAAFIVPVPLGVNENDRSTTSVCLACGMGQSGNSCGHWNRKTNHLGHLRGVTLT